MKKRFVVLLCIPLVLLLSQCEIQEAKPDSVKLSVDTAFVERTSDFAFDFLRKLEKEDGEKNYFVSPLSLHVALGMLLNGSDNGSKEELLKTLKLEGLSLDMVNNAYLELIEKLPILDAKVTNKMANSVWQRTGFPTEETFQELMKSYFKADYNVEPFDDTTLNKINQWASDNTNAKIPKVLDELDAGMVMVLMNALYFKGDWALQFEKDKTRDALFYGSAKTQNVEMMAKNDTFAFADMGPYKALDMAYGSGNYQMRVLLPIEGNVNSLINEMSLDTWTAINNTMAVQKVQVGFPKFKMEYEKKLNSVLAEMGMPSLFTNDADLSKISPPAGKIKVGFVKQNTFVAVDEEGTEAAAVTTIGIETSSLPAQTAFICDKPFVFFIYEKSSGTIQFAGKILNLEK